MSVKLNSAQVSYLNRVHNTYPGLLETALSAISKTAPHILTGRHNPKLIGPPVHPPGLIGPPRLGSFGIPPHLIGPPIHPPKLIGPPIHKPHFIGPPSLRGLSPLGNLGATTSVFGSTSITGDGGVTLPATYDYTTGTATPPTTTSNASDTSNFWTSITGVLTSAIPAYIGAGGVATPGNTSVTPGQTSGLLSSFGIGTGSGTMLLLLGAAVVAFVFIKKRKKK